MTERERIVRHVAGCAVCGWLSRYAIRTRDPSLLDAAIRLREEHGENDAEHRAFGRTPATAQVRSSSMRITLPGGDR